MASNVKYAVAIKNAGLDAITSAIGASGFLRIYSGTQPASPDAELSGNTMLAQLALSATFAPAASGGVLTANAIATEASADNTGTATWATLCTAAGVRKVDMSVGTASADLIMNSVGISAGAQVSVSSLTITAAN